LHSAAAAAIEHEAATGPRRARAQCGEPIRRKRAERSPFSPNGRALHSKGQQLLVHVRRPKEHASLYGRFTIGQPEQREYERLLVEHHGFSTDKLARGAAK